MRWTTLAVALLGIAGCGGKDTTDGEFCSQPENASHPACVGTGSGDSTTSYTGPTYMEPVAVGFEVSTVLYDDGTWNDINYGTNVNPPMVRMIFADEAFFSAGSADAQVGHYCEIGVVMRPTPQSSQDPAFDTQTGAPLNWSYDMNLTFAEAYEFQDSYGNSTSCAGMVDPAVYGFYAENLLTPFDGAHLGIGFGPMTDYMWDSWGGKDDPNNADYVDAFFTVYVAINDRDGHWGGCDWTSALLWEVDADDAPLTEPNGYLSQALDTVNAGTGPLPKGYLVSYAYWYQDFPLMDFSNLTNDPVPGQSWLCD